MNDFPLRLEFAREGSSMTFCLILWWPASTNEETLYELYHTDTKLCVASAKFRFHTVLFAFSVDSVGVITELSIPLRQRGFHSKRITAFSVSPNVQHAVNIKVYANVCFCWTRFWQLEFRSQFWRDIQEIWQLHIVSVLFVREEQRMI